MAEAYDASPTGFLEELLCKAPLEERRPPSVLEPISEDELTDCSALAALALAARGRTFAGAVEAPGASAGPWETAPGVHLQLHGGL